MLATSRVAIVLPFKSRPIRIGESGGTTICDSESGPKVCSRSGKMIVSGMPRAWAVMIAVELTLPTSIAFPASAAATAEPLVAFSNVTSSPAFLNSPLF